MRRKVVALRLPTKTPKICRAEIYGNMIVRAGGINRASEGAYVYHPFRRHFLRLKEAAETAERYRIIANRKLTNLSRSRICSISLLKRVARKTNLRSIKVAQDPPFACLPKPRMPTLPEEPTWRYSAWTALAEGDVLRAPWRYWEDVAEREYEIACKKEGIVKRIAKYEKAAIQFQIDANSAAERIAVMRDLRRLIRRSHAKVAGRAADLRCRPAFEVAVRRLVRVIQMPLYEQ